MRSMEGRDTYRRLTKCSLMAVLSCLLLLSCDKGEVVEAWDETTDKVCFGVSYDDDEATTRGTPITSNNFYDTFHVLAYRTTSAGVLASQFFMNDDVKKSGTTWSTTSKTYYWPGAEHKLKFYAWAPATDAFTSVPTNSSGTSLGYTVPDAAADQKDLMVAVTSDISGDNDKAVPLTFNHICTAVSVKVGDQMQAGTIKSITLEGVKYKGTYNMADGRWTLTDDTYDFKQVLNKDMTGSETSGTAVTPTEGTFMMLPQTLPDGAKIVVVFETSSGTTRTLEASIAGGEWKKGVPMVYNLSITSESSIEIQKDDQEQDAHYVTFPITVHVKDCTGSWTLTSDNTSAVTFTDENTDLRQQGYWIEEEKGTASINGKGNGDFTYYVYVTENVSDAARNIKFTLTPSTGSPVTATVTQLCPNWNSSGVGYERIEDGSYAFGFSWDRVATFS